MLESGEVDKSILQLRFRDNDGHHWVLPPGSYRAFGLTTALMAASTNLLSQPSDMSSVQLPLLYFIKLEFLDGLVHLSSDSLEGELSSASLPSPAAHTPKTDSKCTEHSKSVFTLVGSSSHSNLSRPPFHPNTRECPNVMQCLRRLASIPGSRNELPSINYYKIAYQKVQYLPPSYNGDGIFELPPSRVSTSASISKNTMDSIDKRFDGHTWCRTITSNIHNSQGLTFRKSSYVGQLIYNNENCDFLSRSSKRNETEWSGRTNTPFNLGHLPPPDSILVCNVYKVPPTCVNFCNARIYYVLSKSDMTRACIHLGMHNHLVSDGVCQETIDTISSLVAQEVSKTPTAKNSTIAMVASKEFLDKYFIHNGLGPKKMLRGQELEDVLDKFEQLSSPNLRNTISLCRSGNKRGAYDSIMAMKTNTTIEYIHANVFPGQGKDKVYVFKMLEDGPGSGVDLVKRMQPGGDLENAWLIFDHVKHVKEWTTMVCHVYNATYCKVMTIAVCDMQSEDTKVQCIMWRELNDFMTKNGVENTNFKGFMADSTQANWNVVQIVYGSGDPKVPMEN
jgi:hypothetical protein